MDNIKTIYISMPVTISGYTIYKDDFYTIVLNSNLTYEKNKETYLHEYLHIINKDVAKECSVDDIEIIAHERKI